MHNNTVIMYVCIIRSVIMYALIVIMHNKFVRTIVTLYCMDHRIFVLQATRFIMDHPGCSVLYFGISVMSNSEDEDPEETDLLTFLDEVERFLQVSERALASANEAYASYVLERLETCIIVLALVTETLAEAARGTFDTYVEMIRELSEICWTISVKYEQKLDQVEASAVTVAYHPQLKARLGSGRPCFDISREQLLYLSSLSFSWTSTC